MDTTFTGGRTHRNTNDCWVDALAHALDITYRKARNKLYEYVNPTGTIPMDLFGSILRAKGFATVDIEEEFLSVEEAIKLFDSTNNKVVLYALPQNQLKLAKGEMKTGHIVYVKDKVIHDFEDKNFLKYIAIDLYIKPEETKTVNPLEQMKLDVQQAMIDWSALTEADFILKDKIGKLIGKDVSNQAHIAMIFPSKGTKKIKKEKGE